MLLLVATIRPISDYIKILYALPGYLGMCQFCNRNGKTRILLKIMWNHGIENKSWFNFILGGGLAPPHQYASACWIIWIQWRIQGRGGAAHPPPPPPPWEKRVKGGGRCKFSNFRGPKKKVLTSPPPLPPPPHWANFGRKQKLVLTTPPPPPLTPSIHLQQMGKNHIFIKTFIYECETVSKAFSKSTVTQTPVHCIPVCKIWHRQLSHSFSYSYQAKKPTWSTCITFSNSFFILHSSFLDKSL